MSRTAKSRRKFTPLLSREEAYYCLQRRDFKRKIFYSVKEALELEFVSRFYRQPTFELTFENGFEEAFFQVYRYDKKCIVQDYLAFYEDNPHLLHHQMAFFHFVVQYLVEKLEVFFLGLSRTDGYGAIY